MKESKLRLMKENTRLNRKIRLSKLKTRNSSPRSQAHQKLETLAEVAMSLYVQEETCDAASIPNPRKAAETPKDQHWSLKTSG